MGISVVIMLSSDELWPTRLVLFSHSKASRPSHRRCDASLDKCMGVWLCRVARNQITLADVDE